MILRLHRVLLVSSILASCGSAQSEFASHKHESARGSLPYRLFSPRGAATAAEDAQYPLVLFLHGAGERGENNRSQLRHGARSFATDAAQAEHPAYVLAPQCPRGMWWHDGDNLAMCLEIIDSLSASGAKIDPDRIYLTGLSMGGYGTWLLLPQAPDRFAAAVPICGGGKPKQAPAFAHVPIWAFHGDADRTVPVDKSRKMVEATLAATQKKELPPPRYTEYPGVAHNSWTRTYADREVHDWLFAQRRGRTPLLVDDARVVFFGDSITEAAVRPGGFIDRIENAVEAHPAKPAAELIGAGISGHKVPDLQARLKKDVLDHEPTAVVIYIGINDVWHSERDKGTPIDAYESGLDDLLQKIDAAGAALIVCTPSVIGEAPNGEGRHDPALDRYAAVSRKLARKHGARLVDLRTRFIDHLHVANDEEPKAAGILTSDGVHLNAAGNAFVAARLLEALGLPPRLD